MKPILARSDCHFFHVIDLPDEAPTPGDWDFRATEAAYHGGYDVAGKSILEIGSATGAHAFWMEQQGARVTPYDLSPEDEWDMLPAPSQDAASLRESNSNIIRRINNGWAYCRDRIGSNLDLSHGSIYDVPASLGCFDAITFGSVLLHLRDPMGAVQRLAPRASDAVLVMDRLPPGLDASEPLTRFMPAVGKENEWGTWTWWWATPKVYENLLRLLGFTRFEMHISAHRFVPMGKDIDLYTLVARR